MFMNKKAVSPLIATVLLVMIVVSIGAAVMVVIQGVYQEQEGTIQTQQQFIKCGVDVETKVLSVNDKYRVCWEQYGENNGGKFAIQLENTGIKDISDWRFRVIGNTIIDGNGDFEGLDKGTVDSFEFNFTEVSGNVSKIQLMPQIPGSQQNPIVTCNEPNLEWDGDDLSDLDNCSDVSWISPTINSGEAS